MGADEATLTNRPFVSVLMTCFNRQKYIAEAIESVLSSTYSNFELIIVDDGSIDKSVEIAKAFAAKDQRIQVHVNEKNLGDYPNRNRAANLAKGDYIMYCDSDDTFLSEGIEYCVNAMQMYPNCFFGIYWPFGEGMPFVRDGKEAAQKNFFGEPFLSMAPGSTIIRRDFFFKVGCYPEDYGPANDMYFNLKVICYTDIVLLPKRFSTYRLHDDQEIKNEIGYLLNGHRYFFDAMRDLPLPIDRKQILWLEKKGKRRFLVNLASYSFRTGDLAGMWSVYQKSRFSLKDIAIAIFQI